MENTGQALGFLLILTQNRHTTGTGTTSEKGMEQVISKLNHMLNSTVYFASDRSVQLQK